MPPFFVIFGDPAMLLAVVGPMVVTDSEFTKKLKRNCHEILDSGFRMNNIPPSP
jgi:hypothetical protein